jgi:hypothetical protein
MSGYHVKHTCGHEMRYEMGYASDRHLPENLAKWAWCKTAEKLPCPDCGGYEALAPYAPSVHPTGPCIICGPDGCKFYNETPKPKEKP